MPDNNPTANATPTERVTFRLPPFWPEQPVAWFAQVEGQFNLYGITDDEKKYYSVVSNLDTRYASEVVDIIISPPNAQKYEKLKRELVDRLSTSQEEKTKQLLEFEELGDRKPSQFLRHLRGLAGSTVPDDLLRTIWSGRLPPYTQAILATVKAQPLDDAAKLADQISETWPQGNTLTTPSCSTVSQKIETTGETFEVSTIIHQLDAISKRLEDLEGNRSRSRDQKRYHRNSRSQSRSRPRENNPKYCFYHNRFAEKARKCTNPCEYPKNQ
ncbi:hypothetical protein RI129_009788 [Pyrocoelia pectoralis]|uniref:DUF7041 domain-containing protein n=1 Tax=Pyrocoelia pectoralis TaxID=417401 RepID=A0AAN7ZIM6_9COLE